MFTDHTAPNEYFSTSDYRKFLVFSYDLVLVGPIGMIMVIEQEMQAVTGFPIAVFSWDVIRFRHCTSSQLQTLHKSPWKSVAISPKSKCLSSLFPFWKIPVCKLTSLDPKSSKFPVCRVNICTVYVYIRETFGGYQVDTVKLGHFNYLIKFTYRLTLGFQVMEFHVKNLPCMYSGLVTWEIFFPTSGNLILWRLLVHFVFYLLTQKCIASALIHVRYPSLMRYRLFWKYSLCWLWHWHRFEATAIFCLIKSCDGFYGWGFPQCWGAPT